jgi:CheY-like chemotaxis protein
VRVLVVDDEPSIRLALRRFFAREGWEVEEADDGRVALAKLVPSEGPAPHFDAIICDLRMPGCTGAELHERLRVAQPERLPHLILATGDTVSPEVADFVRRTTCPVLQKPFELKELRLLLQRIVKTGGGSNT